MVGARGSGGAAAAQRPAGIGAGEMQRGIQRGRDAGAEGKRQGREQHGDIDVHVRAALYGMDEESAQRGEQQPGEEDAAGGAQPGEEQAFCESLAHKPGAPGAEGGAQGDLSLALHAPRQQQSSDVDAGDQEDGEHGGGERPQSPSDVAFDCVLQADELLATAAIAIRVRPADTGEHNAEVGLSLLAGHPWFQQADGREPVVAATVDDQWIRMQRRVDSVLHAQRITKPRRHDADAGIRMSVKFKGPTDDAGLPVEVGLPHVEAQHGDIVFARLVFAGAIAAAEDRRDAEDVKEVIRALDPVERDRTRGRLQVDALIRRNCGEGGKDVILRAEVFEAGQ